MKLLTREELQQVRQTVDSLLADTHQPQMTEEAFARSLAASDVNSLPDLSVAENAAAEFNRYQPIIVDGKLLSETIIEQRR